jgi:anti-anti-sigma factor
MADKTFSTGSSIVSDLQAGLIAMTINISKRKDHCTIKIDGDFSIYEVAEYHKKLFRKCGSVTSARVELSQDLEIDTAGIQLLISFQKQLQANDGDLTVQSKGGKFPQIIEVFNLAKQFKFFEEG